MVENFSWTDSGDDKLISDFAVEVTGVIEGKLKAAGQAAKYKYMNDAGLGQEIFQNYGPGSLERLKDIRTKYDPSGVYTDLMPGGWKVDGA